MPYDDFPDLTKPAPKAPDAATLKQAKGLSKWAQTFGGTGTNIMQRVRHNQDIARETTLMQAAQEAYQNNEIRTNKVAQDFLFRQEALDDKRAQAAVKLKHDEDLHPLKLETERARASRIRQQEREAEKVAKYKEDTGAQLSMDNEAFGDNMRASGAKPGTQEYVDELVKNRTNFPGSHVLYGDLFRAYSGSKADPDEVFETRKTALDAAGPNTTVKTVLPGGVTVTDRPSSDAKELQGRLTHLESLSTRSNLDDAQKAYFKGEIDKVKAQMTGPTDSAPTATPKVRKFNPETGKIE